MSAGPEHLEGLTAEAETPDGTAFARLRGTHDIRVSFAPGYYAHTTEARLADKLVQLGRLLWVARMREYYRQKSNLLEREVRGEGRPRNERQAARREARDSIVATGRSDDGRVELSAVGLLNWSATIAPGTVRQLSEEQFTAACSQAAERLVEDHLWQLKLVWSSASTGRTVG